MSAKREKQFRKAVSQSRKDLPFEENFTRKLKVIFRQVKNMGLALGMYIAQNKARLG